LTRSGGRGALLLGIVVRSRLSRTAPRKPCSFINGATVQRHRNTFPVHLFPDLRHAIDLHVGVNADQNLTHSKARRKPAAPISLDVQLLAPDDDSASAHRARLKLAFPWMENVDRLLDSLGFKPGEHICFSVDYVRQCLSITPHHDYRIGNRHMTEEEIAERERFYSESKRPRRTKKTAATNALA
jgi:hypothetical protein